MDDIDISAVEGEYYLLEKDNWIKLNITLNLKKSRVNRLPAMYKNRELRIYITNKQNIQNTGILECGEYLLHNKQIWEEIRKKKGDEKGKPYTVPDKFFMRFPKVCKDKQLLIYVKKV